MRLVPGNPQNALAADRFEVLRERGHGSAEFGARRGGFAEAMWVVGARQVAVSSLPALDEITVVVYGFVRQARRSAVDALEHVAEGSFRGGAEGDGGGEGRGAGGRVWDGAQFSALARAC